MSGEARGTGRGASGGRKARAAKPAPAPERSMPLSDPAPIAVGVSGAGSNLRALAAAIGRGEVPARIDLVFADRACPALAWAEEQGIETAVVPAARPRDAAGSAAEDETLAATLVATGIEAVVLAGYMRILGPAVLAAFPRRILNVHPSLLPAFPGAHAVRDALAAGVAVTGVTVHLVDATLDGGPIVAQEAVPVLAGDDEASLLGRLHAAEHRLLPRAVSLLAAGALAVDGRRVRIDAARAAEALPVPAPGAAVGLRQDGARGPRRRAGGPGVGAREHRRDRTRAPRRRAARHRRERGHRLPGDAGRPGEDPPPARPRGDPRGPPAPRPPRAARRGGDRPVRPRRREPLPVRRGGGEARPLARRARGGDRHRRAVHGPRRGEEPRERGDRHLAGPVRLGPARHPDARGGPAGAPVDARGRGVPPHRGLRRADRRGPPGPDGRGRDPLRRRARAPRRDGPVPADPRDRPREGGRRSGTARTPISRRRATAGPGRGRHSGRSRPARRRSRASPSATTTSSTPRPRPPSGGRSAGPPASSSSTRTRAAPRSAARSSRPGGTRSRATRSRRSAGWSR